MQHSGTPTMSSQPSTDEDRKPIEDRTPSRVLQVVEAANAGVGRHALDICSGLSSIGVDTHLIYSPLRTDSLFVRGLQGMSDVTCVSYPIRRQLHPSDLRAVHFVRKYLQEMGPFDLVHGHSSKGGAIARLAAIGLGIPTVYTPNAIGTLHPGINRFTRLLVASIEKVLAKVPGTIVAVSTEELDHLISLGIGRRRICLIPNGVPDVPVPDRQQARATLGLKTDALIIGFVGRFTPQKAPQDLLRAFVLIATEVPQLRVAMIGWGELEAKLRGFAQEAGIADRVDWLGEQPGQVSMPAFDIFALPSRYEGMPYVLLEALVAGLPIVTTDCPGVRSIVEPGVNGRIIEHGCPDRFADALRELAENDRLRASFGRASRKKAREFTLERMLKSTLDHYQSHCSRGSRAR